MIGLLKLSAFLQLERHCELAPHRLRFAVDSARIKLPAERFEFRGGVQVGEAARLIDDRVGHFAVLQYVQLQDDGTHLEQSARYGRINGL